MPTADEVFVERLKYAHDVAEKLPRSVTALADWGMPTLDFVVFMVVDWTKRFGYPLTMTRQGCRKMDRELEAHVLRRSRRMGRQAQASGLPGLGGRPWGM